MWTNYPRSTMATVATRVAGAALAEQQFVTLIDVLVGLGWLAQPSVDRWQHGRDDARARITDRIDDVLGAWRARAD